MRQAGWILLLAVAAAVAVWWLFLGGEDARVEYPTRDPVRADTNDVRGGGAPDADPITAEPFLDPEREDPLTGDGDPDGHVWIQARTEQGKPVAGVPVELELGGGRHELLFEGTTREPDGLVDAGPWEAYVEAARGFARVMISPASGVPTRGTVELDLEQPPREPVVLVVPGDGEVRVRVLNRTGAPLYGPMRVGLRQVPDGRQPPGTLLPRASALPEDGWARFVGVPTGCRYRATWSRSLRRDEWELEFEGPARSGDVVEATLEVDADLRAVTARVVDEFGSPLPHLRLSTDLAQGPPERTSSLGSQINSDGEGRIQHAVMRPLGPGESLRLTLENRTLLADGLPRHGEAETRTLDPSGVTDLGDIVLKPLPLLVSGQVVDASGAGRRVYLVIEHETSASSRPDEKPWSVLEDARFDPGQEGRFAIRGLAPAGALRLQPRMGITALGDPVPFLAGTSGLIVTVDLPPLPTSLIETRVLLDDGMAADAVRIVFEQSQDIEDAGSRGRTPNLRFLKRRADGLWRLEGLPAEPGTLLVTPKWALAPLARISNVIPWPPGGSADPRLAEIDVRGRIKRVHVEVVDPEGGPVFTNLRVHAESGSGEIPIRGAADIHIPFAGLVVTAVTSGRTPLPLGRLTGDRRIVLHPAPEIELWTEGVDWTRMPFAVRASIFPIGSADDGFREGVRPGEFKQSGICRMRSTGPGPHAVRLDLHRKGTWRRVSIFEGEILVADSPGLQDFVLKIDPERLASALRELER